MGTRELEQSYKNDVTRTIPWGKKLREGDMSKGMK